MGEPVIVAGGRTGATAAAMHDPGGIDLESTVALLARIRAGDGSARERLLARYLPALQRWARGRLPARARSLATTDDLVQETFLSVLDRLHEFEPRHEGAFLYYLRRTLINKIRDTLRRAERGREDGSLPREIAEDGPTPLECLIGREKLEAYEDALRQLAPDQQEAFLLRMELDQSYEEIAQAIGSPSPNAARMVVRRAVLRLVEVLDVH